MELCKENSNKEEFEVEARYSSNLELNQENGTK